MSSNIIKEQFFTWFKVVIKNPVEITSSPDRPPKSAFVVRDLEVGWCEYAPSAGQLAANTQGNIVDIQCSPVFQSRLEAARWLKTDDGKTWIVNAQTYRLFIHKQVVPTA